MVRRVRKTKKSVSVVIGSDTEDVLAVERNSEIEPVHKLNCGAQGALIEAILHPTSAEPTNHRVSLKARQTEASLEEEDSQQRQERDRKKNNSKGAKKKDGKGLGVRDILEFVPTNDVLNALANATASLSSDQLLRGDAIPAQRCLKELFRGGMLGAVDDNAQSRKRCLQVVEVSVHVTNAQALCHRGSKPDIFLLDLLQNSR